MALIEVTIDGETRSYKYSESIQGEVVYDITNDEVGIIRQSKIDVFEHYFEWNEAFKKHMAAFVTPEKDKKKEEERKYKLHATMSVIADLYQAISQENGTLAQQIVDEADQRIDAKVQEFKDDDALYKSVCANGHKMKSGEIREVYWCKGRKMVRVWNKQAKGITVWYPRKDVEFQLKQEAEENKRKPKKMAKEAELKIFEKKFWDTNGNLCDFVEEFNKNCNYQLFKENNNLDLSMGAQLLRYSGEAAYGANINWAEERTIKIGAKAEGSFAFAQAQGSFSVHLPNENGFGLMQCLKEAVPNFVKDDFTEVFMKISLTTKGSAFVGACASVSLDMGIKLAKKKGDTDKQFDEYVKNKNANKNQGNEDKGFAGAEAGLSLFAGAKSQAEIILAMEMMLVEDEVLDQERKKIADGKEGDQANISSKGLGEWKTLGDAVLGAYAAIGVGIDAALKCGYEQGIGFVYHAKIGATLKVGAGTFVKGTVNAELIGKFILTVVNGINWKGVSDVMNETGEMLYHTVMSNCFYLGKKVDEVYQSIYNEVKDNFIEFLDFVSQKLESFTSAGFNTLKIADDRLDEIIPGYSSFKQYDRGFLIIKEAYYYFKEIEEKERAIKAVHNANNDRQRWNYATWQMKVNLIYDMRHDEKWFGKYSDEERGQAVLDVLDSARHREEFGKIVNNLKRPEETIQRDKVHIESLLSNEQLPEYNNLKFKHNLHNI